MGKIKYLILVLVVMILCGVGFVRLYGSRFQDGIDYERTLIFEQNFSDKGEKRGNMTLGGVHLSQWPRQINDDYKWFQPQYMEIDWIKHYVVRKKGGEVNYYLMRAEYPQEEAQ